MSVDKEHSTEHTAQELGSGPFAHGFAKIYEPHCERAYHVCIRYFSNATSTYNTDINSSIHLYFGSLLILNRIAT